MKEIIEETQEYNGMYNIIIYKIAVQENKIAFFFLWLLFWPYNTDLVDQEN